MKASIDRLGRVVVPKPIRDRLQLRGGETLEVEERDGVIELRPIATEVRVVDTPEGPVLHRVESGEPLTDELVREVLEQVRLPSEALAAGIVRRCSDLDIVGGAVYDALVALTAAEGGARLLTRDVRAVRTYRRIGIDAELVA